MAEYHGLLDPLAQDSRGDELTDDAAYLQALVDSELGLTLALVDAGLVPDWMTSVCARLADASTLDLAAIAAGGRSGGNPVIPLVKALGARAEALRAGSSDHLHVGATSQDILDTATMLIAARAVEEVLARLGDLADRFAELADRHRSTLMVGRTLGQHAAPTTFGFIAAGWLEAVLQAIERLAAVRRGLPLQLGGAVGTLDVLSSIARARLPDEESADVVDVVVRRLSERLELTQPVISWHTDRVVIGELASALSVAAGVAGSFGLDVTILSRTEVAELGERLPAGHGGSSAMPHKRNPVTAVLITAAARQAPGLVATLHSSLLAEDQRPSGAWHAEWIPLRRLQGIAITSVTGAADLAARLDLDAGRMLANLRLTGGLAFSERVTTILGEARGKHAAFELVERASRDAVQTGRPLQAVLTEYLEHEPDLPASVSDEITDAFDPDTIGMPYASAGIDRVLARHRARSSAPAVETVGS